MKRNVFFVVSLIAIFSCEEFDLPRNNPNDAFNDNNIFFKISESYLDFGKTQVIHEITLTNDDRKTLSWMAFANQTWLVLSNDEGELNAGQSSELTISVDRTLVDEGIYDGVVTFEVNGKVIDLEITMEAGGPVLTSSVTSLDFGNAETNLFLTLGNGGSKGLDWSATAGEQWISINPLSGSLASGEERSISITVERNGLNLGDFSGTISLTSDGGDIEIDISMSVAIDSDGDGVTDDEDADVDGDGLIEIYTINDLNAIRDDLTATGEGKQGAPSGGFIGYELMNDLDFSDDASYSDLSLKPSVTTGSGWEPLGNSDNTFNTIFEGNDFTIANFFLNRTSDYVSLFGYTGTLSNISNLAISISFFSGGAKSAGLVSLNRGDITNCSIIGEMSAGEESGLLVGIHATGEISNCFTEGFLDAVGSYVGGLIGNLGNEGRTEGNWVVTNSYSKAKVIGVNYAGGLVGYRRGGSGEIKACYATGDVQTIGGSSTTGDGAGGLIGGNYEGVITNSYATGNVISARSDAGGFVGFNRGTITSCFSTGNVIGASDFGGFCGDNFGSISESNYWDTQTSNLTNSDGGTGLTTSQMQSPTSADGIYITWGTDVWDFGTSTQYPALKGMPGGLGVQR